MTKKICFECEKPVSKEELEKVDVLVDKALMTGKLDADQFAHLSGPGEKFHDGTMNLCMSCYNRLTGSKKRGGGKQASLVEYNYNTVTKESEIRDPGLRGESWDVQIIVSLPGRVSKRDLIKHYNQTTGLCFFDDYKIKGLSKKSFRPKTKSASGVLFVIEGKLTDNVLKKWRRFPLVIRDEKDPYNDLKWICARCGNKGKMWTWYPNNERLPNFQVCRKCFTVHRMR